MMWVCMLNATQGLRETYGMTAASAIAGCDINSASSSAGGTCP